MGGSAGTINEQSDGSAGLMALDESQAG